MNPSKIVLQRTWILLCCLGLNLFPSTSSADLGFQIEPEGTPIFDDQELGEFGPFADCNSLPCALKINNQVLLINGKIDYQGDTFTISTAVEVIGWQGLGQLTAKFRWVKDLLIVDGSIQRFFTVPNDIPPLELSFHSEFSADLYSKLDVIPSSQAAAMLSFGLIFSDPDAETSSYVSFNRFPLCEDGPDHGPMGCNGPVSAVGPVPIPPSSAETACCVAHDACFMSGKRGSEKDCDSKLMKCLKAAAPPGGGIYNAIMSVIMKEVRAMTESDTSCICVLTDQIPPATAGRISKKHHGKLLGSMCCSGITCHVKEDCAAVFWDGEEPGGFQQDPDFEVIVGTCQLNVSDWSKK